MRVILYHQEVDKYKNELYDLKIDFESDFNKLKEVINNYDGLIAFGLDNSIDLSNIKWIQSIAAGVDWALNNPTLNQEVVITRMITSLERPLFEHALARILHYYQNMDAHYLNQKKNIWKRFASQSIFGKKILVIGTGKIGSYIGNQLHNLGMLVYGVNSTGYEIENFLKCYTLDTIDKSIKYDVVLNVLPSTSQTKNVFNDRFFNDIKMDVFINIGRGDAVDIKALTNSLNKQLIKCAYLDVFPEEPVLKSSDIWQVSNLIMTPHIAGFPSFFEIIKTIRKNFNIFINQGQFDESVNLEKGY